jgi:hypothetical protein
MDQAPQTGSTNADLIGKLTRKIKSLSAPRADRVRLVPRFGREPAALRQMHFIHAELFRAGSKGGATVAEAAAALQ